MAKQKKTLQGFNVTKVGQGAANTITKLGKALTKKNVCPVGGNTGGVTGGSKAASGDPKMKPVGGKCVAGGGKGPAVVPDNKTGLATKNLGVMGNKLGKQDVRPTP